MNEFDQLQRHLDSADLTTEEKRVRVIEWQYDSICQEDGDTKARHDAYMADHADAIAFRALCREKAEANDKKNDWHRWEWRVVALFQTLVEAALLIAILTRLK